MPKRDRQYRRALKELHETCYPDLSPAEFRQLVSYCDRHGFSPLTRWAQPRRWATSSGKAALAFEMSLPAMRHVARQAGDGLEIDEPRFVFCPERNDAKPYRVVLVGHRTTAGVTHTESASGQWDEERQPSWDAKPEERLIDCVTRRLLLALYPLELAEAVAPAAPERHESNFHSLPPSRFN